MTEKDIIEQEVAKLTKNHILGRSRAYARLLEYLAGCSINGRRPKEFEIASKVFGKGSDFDPSQDSLVRVYVHNLRQKLDNYYAREDNPGGDRLAIPKGEYRLA
ncbi:MAG: tetratricopeptide repeat protein, partial [Verrucomicrobia bacterium]|nr:tetratricopeptide repeat protein [Verrucomicrobiota bacterium]